MQAELGLGRRGFALESARARICREVGARVSTNVYVRDLDLPAPNVHDARRLEIIAEGLPIFGRAQLAIDTTLVAAHQCDGTARPGTATRDGAAMCYGSSRKEATQNWLCWHWKLAAGGQPRLQHF